MKIIKRNGDKESFNLSKVINAVNEAFNELDLEPEGYKLAAYLQERYLKESEDLTIDDIQGIVIMSLYEMGYNKVADAYYEYKVRQDIRRKTIKNVYYTSEFLSKEFLNQYKHYPPHMEPVAQFTFLRTYSRDIPELGRRETFKETIIRAIDHNIKMDTRSRTPEVKEILKQEAEHLFKMHYDLKGFLSGRALFTGGSAASQKYPLSMFNCSFVEPTKTEDFFDILYLLSVGAGVGYRATWDVVEQLPTFRTNVELEVLPFTPKPKRMRLERTKITDGGDTVYIEIGDSKEGWAEAVSKFVEFHTVKHKYKKIYLIFDNVRPEGEPLLTFGGYASGHKPLEQAMIYMNELIVGDYMDSHGNVLTKAMVKGRPRPIHLMHISNLIANAIVVGGVRRSAMICLFSRDDEELLNAKTGFIDYEDPKIKHYWLSNNTMIFEKGYTPSREEIKAAIERVKKYGEPGFMNETELIRRNSKARGANPCFEILLRSYQTCNLVTYDVSKYVLPNGELDLYNLREDVAALTRAAYRVTLNKLELEHWNIAQEEDRLLGVSPTGWMDAMEMMNADIPTENGLLVSLKERIKKAAAKYAKILGLNEPLNRTAVKPSGTLGLIANGSSAGVHMSHAPYYYRTIRVSKNNPIFDVIKRTNWRIEDDVTQPNSTAIVYFPIKSGAKKTKFDVTAIEQLDRYKRFQKYYTEQNTSVTISVQGDKEWEDVVNWLDNNWDDFTGVSFLALTNHQYKQAPYIDITEEEYNEAIEGIGILDHDFVTKHMDLGKLYDSAEEENDDPECATGACGLDRL